MKGFSWTFSIHTQHCINIFRTFFVIMKRLLLQYWLFQYVLFIYFSPYVIHLCVKIGSYKFQHRKLGFNLSKKTIFMTTYLLIFHIDISWKKVRSIFTTPIFSIDSRTYNYKLCYIESFPTNTKHFQLALLFQLSWSSIDIWFSQFMQIAGFSYP